MRSLTWFHLIQTLFLLGVIGLIVERVRTLAFRADIDAYALRRAISTAIRAGDLGRAAALVEHTRPAYAAEVVWPLLDPSRARDDRELDSEDMRMTVEASAVRGMRALRIFATVGSALGFISAATDIYWIFNGEHGLLGLRAALVESIGLSRAAVSVGLGVATSALALGSWSAFKPLARRIILDARRMLATVAGLLEEEPRVRAEDE